MNAAASLWELVASHLAGVPQFVWQTALAVATVTATLYMLRYARRALVAVWAAVRGSGRPAEDVLTIAVACIATAVSAQGMWRFTGDVLGFEGPLRVLLFAFIELAVLASAVRARRNMRENYSAGIDGIAVWALAALTAVLSSLDARSLAEAVFRLAAPLVAAWLWERGMAIERVRLTGRSRIKWRITPERAMVRLGLAEASDRTAGEVDVHRRLTRVALAAKKVGQLRESGASDRKIRAAVARRDRALDRAVEHTDLARDATRQAALLDVVTAIAGGDSLTEMVADASAPWAHLDHPAVTGATKNSEALELAAAMRGWTTAIEQDHVADRETSAAVTSMAAFITGRPVSALATPGRRTSVSVRLPAGGTVPGTAPANAPGGVPAAVPASRAVPAVKRVRVPKPKTVPAAVPELYLRAAQHFAGDVSKGRVPPIRRVKDELHVGQDKAVEVRTYLSTLPRT